MNWALKTDRRDRFVIDEVQTEVRHGRRLVWRNFDGERNQGENRKDAQEGVMRDQLGISNCFLVRRRREIRLDS